LIPDLKIVYCLTSSGGDLYDAMTRVSLATLRLTNPTACIEIACDQQTQQDNTILVAINKAQACAVLNKH
jgi:hypothetical protein